jgi:hypothetical protein
MTTTTTTTTTKPMTIIRQAEPQGFFAVTYSIHTLESVESGDVAAQGYCDTNGYDTEREDWSWALADLLQFKGYCFEGDGARVPRWISCDASMTDLFVQSGGFWGDLLEDESNVSSAEVSIHRPDWITDASWIRVCRLLGWTSRY